MFIKIFYHTRETQLELDPDNDRTVLNLKEKISKERNIMPFLQHLVYNGRQLDESVELSFYGIEDGSAVQLVLRLWMNNFSTNN